MTGEPSSRPRVPAALRPAPLREAVAAARVRAPPGLTWSQVPVYDAIRERPGMGLRELSARVGLRIGTVAYHLGRLESEGHVHSTTAGRMRLLYVGPAQGADHETDRHLVMLRHPTTRMVARAIVEHPLESASAHLARLPLTRRALYHQVARLRGAGLLADAPRRALLPATRLRELLDHGADGRPGVEPPRPARLFL